jgi:hypothetical protein
MVKSPSFVQRMMATMLTCPPKTSPRIMRVLWRVVRTRFLVHPQS